MTTTSKQKHTPGPWTLDTRAAEGEPNGLQNDTKIVVRYSSNGLSSHIARLDSITLCPEHGDVFANARLIRAAPELAEALRECAEILAGFNSVAGPPMYPAVVRARALLAKIDG